MAIPEPEQLKLAEAEARRLMLIHAKNTLRVVMLNLVEWNSEYYGVLAEAARQALREVEKAHAGRNGEIRGCERE